MARTRDTMKLHPTVIQQADVVIQLRRRRAVYGNRDAARDIAARIASESATHRVPPEIMEAAYLLALGDLGRIELLHDGSAIVHNTREQRAAWMARRRKAPPPDDTTPDGDTGPNTEHH